MIEQSISHYLRLLFDRSNEIIFFLNDNHEIIYQNRAAEQVINPIQDVLNTQLCHYCDGMTTENALKSCVECFLKFDKQQDDFQLFIKLKDGSTRPFSASYQSIDEAEGIKVLRLNEVTNQLKTQQTLHQKELTKRILQAQEDERKRISRELHDSIIQNMLNVLVDVRLFKYLSHDELNRKVESTEEALQQLMKSIRNISVELRPSSLDDLGLLSALRSHFKYIEKNYGVSVNFNTNLEDSRFKTEIETAIYRIAQESVFNSVKYANVDFIQVQLNRLNEQLILTVTDEGKGFDMNEQPKGSGLGLFGMKERADAVGGSFEVISQKNNGTEIIVTVPLDS